MVEYINNKASGFDRFKAAADANKKPGIGGMIFWIIIAVLAGWLVAGWLSPSKKSETKPATQDITTQSEDVSSVPLNTISGEYINADVRGLRISNIALNKFYTNKKHDANVALLSGKNEFTEFGFLGQNTDVPTATTKWNVSPKSDAKHIIMSWTARSGATFNCGIMNSSDYIIDVGCAVKNNTKTEIQIANFARMVRAGDNANKVGVKTGGIARVNDDLQRAEWKKLSDHSISADGTGFVGFSDQYWETIVAAVATENADVPDQTMRIKQRSDKMFQADAASDYAVIAPGNTMFFRNVVYAGPKDQSALSTAAAAIPGIDQTLDYGWFWFLTRPFLWAINAINSLVANYGVAIILFTILLRLLMWPLTKKSFTGMNAMQKMQPEMQRIQKLYANDKVRQQSEMMALYKRTGASPMSGCLPLIIQLPIFIALYKALLISVPMRSAAFLWISDLAAMDPFYILPVLMGLTMWWQQKLQTPTVPAKSGDPMAATQKMMKWMPVFFVVMFAWMPAGLVLYWTVSNLFGIVQMQIIKRTNN